ncbi:MAG TPA: hypothetical protein VLC28_02680 [Flavitalea sp.]|nr:hypothetical protein [Flavitalea sp.]
MDALSAWNRFLLNQQCLVARVEALGVLSGSSSVERGFANFNEVHQSFVSIVHFHELLNTAGFETNYS